MTTIERYAVNTTKRRASRWHIDGDWPTPDYFRSDPNPVGMRFADPGDTVECVVLETTTHDYHGIAYTAAAIRTVRTFAV